MNNFKHPTTALLAVVNLVPAVLLYIFYLKSWVQTAFAADTTNIVYAISGLLVLGILLSFYRAWQTDQELADITHISRLSEPSFNATMSDRLAPIYLMSYAAVVLGLIGTIVGFIIGLHTIGTDTLGDLNSMVSSVMAILGGMKVAFYTTLVGCIVELWLAVNLLIINRAMVRLFIKVKEL